MPDKEVSLLVNGLRYEGWKQVQVHSSLEELCQSFSVDFSLKTSEKSPSVQLHEGDVVEVQIGGEPVITGYVDDPTESYDARSHTLSVSGRSKTEDLVDCSAIYQSGRIANKSLKQIADLLCKPFGISVSVAEDLDIDDPIPVFKIQESQSPFEALNDVCRQSGLLQITDPKGNLVLTRASHTVVPDIELRYGVNIKRGTRKNSFRDRFSEYVFKGQRAGTDSSHGADAAHVKARITDDEVKRYRPLLIIDHRATSKRLEQRAKWERNTRAGRAKAITYDVQGWTAAHGLWRPNQLIHVADDKFQIEDDLLIVATDMQRDRQGGRVTTLTMMPKETFDVLNPPKIKRKRGKVDKLAQALAT